MIGMLYRLYPKEALTVDDLANSETLLFPERLLFLASITVLDGSWLEDGALKAVSSL